MELRIFRHERLNGQVQSDVPKLLRLVDRRRYRVALRYFDRVPHVGLEMELVWRLSGGVALHCRGPDSLYILTVLTAEAVTAATSRWLSPGHCGTSTFKISSK